MILSISSTPKIKDLQHQLLLISAITSNNSKIKMIKAFLMNVFGNLFQNKEINLDLKLVISSGPETQLPDRFLHIMGLMQKYNRRMKYKMAVSRAKDQLISFVHSQKRLMRRVIIKNFFFKEEIVISLVLLIPTKLSDFLMKTSAKLNLRRLNFFQKIVS